MCVCLVCLMHVYRDVRYSVNKDGANQVAILVCRRHGDADMRWPSVVLERASLSSSDDDNELSVAAAAGCQLSNVGNGLSASVDCLTPCRPRADDLSINAQQPVTLQRTGANAIASAVRPSVRLFHSNF